MNVAHPLIHIDGISFPSHVLVTCMRELSKSCADMLAKCLRENAEGRMLEDDIDKVMRSVAWQSKTLCEYYAWLDAARAQEAGQECLEEEFLSEEELKSLMV